MPIPIHLAVEDDLSEFVVRRLLDSRPVAYALGSAFKQSGFGYLKKRSPAFNRMAKVCPVLLLTDLDRYPCPRSLIQGWLNEPLHVDFLFRVAVRETEAWLLAHDESFAEFLGLCRVKGFPDPESIRDPKAELLRLARRSPRRELRDALVRVERDGSLRQGPAYNSALAPYVRRLWPVEAAARKCGSLRRVLVALDRLESTWGRRHG